tara:strand:- start:168 stop:899 length:732 start_codon:yes stop_codon:yes gene_type:complete
MILVILAAGRGSRLKSQTVKIPKPLVQIKKKSLIEYNIDFMNKFKKVIIVTGYKGHLIRKKLSNKKILFIKNKNFNSTNMVYSLFCTFKYLKKFQKDVVVCYSDIIFDKSLFTSLKSKGTYLIVLKNWLKIWKLRMKMSLIKKDAEDLYSEKNFLLSIGQKIKNKLPKYQFSGIMKLRFYDIKKLYNFFNSLEDKKIDFTSFLNSALKNKVVKMKIKKTNKFWFEVDNLKDLKSLERLLNNHK